MKKLIAILLCTVMVLSLAACTNDTPAPTTNHEPADTQPSETQGAPASDTVITTAAESYTVQEGSWVSISAKAESSENVKLSYSSADESIAKVSSIGRITGVKAGETTVTVTASDGVTKTVSVIVEEYVFEKVMQVALNVMFNDLELGCYNNETGPVIEITGDGTYTVTFDFATDMSEETLAYGITGLNNLTSIYIKDYQVTTGELSSSKVASCDIRWDSVVVDGVELTITSSEFKSAVKTGGIFDTNDPFNAWEGSYVEEVTTDFENHVLNINLDNPQTVTVTFTLQNLVWVGE